MSEKKLCVKCNERPILIKKRGLCGRCYQRLRKKNYNYYDQKIQYKREVEFIKNYFDHNNWIYQPATFRFNNSQYTPDFYDSERNVFIEVSGSRQAYHQAKKKYSDFKRYYPKIKFEIRKTDGKVLNEDSAMSELYALQ